MKKVLLSVLAAAALAACGSVPTDPAKQGAYYAEQSQAALAKGNLLEGIRNLTIAISRPGGAEQMRLALEKDRSTHNKLIEGLHQDIQLVSTAESVQREYEFLSKIAAARLLSQAEQADLEARFENIVRTGNETGLIPFVINGEIDSIKALSNEKQMQIVYDRTLTSYKNKNFTARDMQALVAYARKSGYDSALLADFKKQLPSLNVRSTELLQVALADPGFAERRKAQLNVNAHLSVKNSDRLFADDVLTQLSRDIHGVTWLPASQGGALELIVERVRDSEKEIPAQSRTVTYSYSQVDTLSAVLLMPKNASYQFDLKTGGAELDYGYVVSTWRDGKKLSENVVRGKLGGEFKKCENPRVVNVFGGVSSAEFMANDDMRAACTNQEAVSIDSLRAQVLEKISAEVLSVPEISEVHGMSL